MPADLTMVEWDILADMATAGARGRLKEDGRTIEGRAQHRLRNLGLAEYTVERRHGTSGAVVRRIFRITAAGIAALEGRAHG